MIGPVPDALDLRRRSGIKQVWRLGDEPWTGDMRIEPNSLDCLVTAIDTGDREATRRRLDRVYHLLAPEGQALLLFLPPSSPPEHLEVIDAMLIHFQWMRYHSGILGEWAGAVPIPAVTAVRAGYNPIVHARRMAAAGRADCAISILKTIPMHLIPDEETLARLALESQRHYFRWQEQIAGIDPPHALFSKARREFAQVTALEPTMWESYACHANYWSYLGRSDMAERVRRSVIYCDPGAIGTIGGLSVPCNGPSQAAACDDQVPEWNGNRPSPRILIISHDFSDYGLDTLYHGLCNFIGPQNVVEFPWKPTLHGKNPEATVGYPCFFNYPGNSQSVADLVGELSRGRFDLILYADAIQMARQGEVRRLLSAAPRVPLILYDTWDDCYTPLRRIADYLGRKNFAVHFKREMLDGVDYGPRTFPLPFGYPEMLIHGGSHGSRDRAVFWAGKNEYGLRPLYIPALERHLDQSFSRRYAQDEYRRALVGSRIGLSFFGCGFDSVRYWELPAHGVMLLAERPPIRIPYNFKEGISAVFFNDLPQMIEKLDFSLQQPEWADRIAAQGREHFLRYHTSTARARQFLGRIAAELGW
jgi:hypothetical protein